MPRASQRAESAANSDFLDSFAAVSEAVESGAGLPEVARAASRALGASVAVVDSSASVLAVACASPEDERAVLSRGDVLELRVADSSVGQLRYRARGPAARGGGGASARGAPLTVGRHAARAGGGARRGAEPSQRGGHQRA